MKRSLNALLFLLGVLVLPIQVHAQWQPDGVPVAAAASFQSQIVAVSDGAGGSIIAWTDGRNGLNDIYAQRLNPDGVALWTAGGIPVVSHPASQFEPAMAPDGGGGAVIVWLDFRGGSSDVYAQRIGPNGAPLWAVDGVPMGASAFSSWAPEIASDGAGGAIVAWYENRSLGTLDDIYASRINSSGTVLWTPNGEVVCNANNLQGAPEVISDGIDGAIILWEDLRPGSHTDIYAQHMNANGVPLWTVNGYPVCNAVGYQTVPRMCADEAGGAVIVWEDSRSGGSGLLYGQRMGYWGVPEWEVNGVFLTASDFNPEIGNVTSDGEGGAIVTWRDLRNGLDWDVYAQRVDGTGTTRWQYNGVAIATGSPDQMFPRGCTDGAGGAIIAWNEDRFSPASFEVYAQRVTAGGTVVWEYGGRAVCTAPNSQAVGRIVADGAGGAVVAWEDERTGPSDDVYAQRLEPRYGYWGHPEPRITSVADIPGDQGGLVKVNWTASDWDDYLLRTITHYSVWRATDMVVSSNAPAGGGLPLVDPGKIGPDFTGAAYVIGPGPDGVDYYWEYLGTQNASGAQGYSYSAATRANGETHYFQVMSHTWDMFVYWISDVLSGSSLDNLAPAAPIALAAQGADSDVLLTWQVVGDADFVHYTVYRGITPGVQPLPANFVANTTDPNFTDVGAVAGAFFYIVTASDVNGNESDPSNVASLSPTTGVGDSPSLTSLRVLQNSPNPFSGAATVSVGLPRASEVTLEVFDVAGRRVSRRVLGAMNAGWKSVTLDARDESGRRLPSGVYFYRVTGAGETITRKMVITR